MTKEILKELLEENKEILFIKEEKIIQITETEKEINFNLFFIEEQENLEELKDLKFKLSIDKNFLTTEKIEEIFSLIRRLA